VKLRRVLFAFRSAMVDIVSTSRKMSTKPDQAQVPAVAADAIVISTPAPIATSPSTSLRPRGRRSVLATVTSAWLSAVGGIDGDVPVLRKSLRQCLHNTAAS
jgi:hypothetical protein